MRDQSRRDDKGADGKDPLRVAPRRTDAQRTTATGTGTAATGLRHGMPGSAGLLSLQRTAGNAAVSRALAVQRHAGCLEEDKEQEQVQRSTGTGVHDVLGTSGRPLPGEVRQDMEARFGGTDFGDVRIHDDSAARRSAQEIGARAYTSGSHIVIGDGGGDRHTLAHELTHVVQQRQGPVAGTDRGDGLNVSDPSDRFEVAAEENARRVLAEPVQRAADPGTRAGATTTTGHDVQRAGSSRGTATVDRPARRQRVKVEDCAEFLAGPSYTRSATRGAGGVYSYAVLGPNGYSSRGTDADSSLPRAIKDARRTYDIRFVAGHLLNADFGGDGKDAKNLTILTPGANSSMKAFDNPIKNAMANLYNVYKELSRLYLPIDRLQYGIEIKVSTSGPDHVWDSTSYPAECISSYIHTSAKVLGESTIDRWYTDYVDGGQYDVETNQRWADVQAKMADVRTWVTHANANDMHDNEQR